jgi:hypothetical protein
MTKLIWTIILFLTSFNLTTLFVNYTKLETIRGGCQQSYCYETTLNYSECYHETYTDNCWSNVCIRTHVFVAQCPGNEGIDPCPFVTESEGVLVTQYYHNSTNCSYSNFGVTPHPNNVECGWFYNHVTRCETSGCYGEVLAEYGGPHYATGTKHKCPPYF